MPGAVIAGDPAAQMADVAGGMDLDRPGLRWQFAVLGQTGDDGLGNQLLLVPVLRGIEIERSGPGCPGERIGAEVAAGETDQPLGRRAKEGLRPSPKA